MKSIPVDTRPLTFIATAHAEPVMDFESKRTKTVEGRPLFQVSVLVMKAGVDGQLIRVKVVGEPQVSPGMFVVLSDLVASPYSIKDKQTGAIRTGTSFRASAIHAAPAPTPAKAG